MSRVRPVVPRSVSVAMLLGTSTALAASPVPAAIKVALYTGPGTGGTGPERLRDMLSAKDDFVVERLGPDTIRDGTLERFDVVIFPGGTARGQSDAIGERGREQVRTFVEQGGGYIGICAGAYLATDGSSWRLRILDAVTDPKWRRGKAAVKIELTDEGRQLFGDLPGPVDIRYANGPMLWPLCSDLKPRVEVLAWFRTEVAENKTPHGRMVNTPAIVRSTFGRGRVFCSSPHPEATPGLEHFILSAVKWVAGVL